MGLGGWRIGNGETVMGVGIERRDLECTIDVFKSYISNSCFNRI